MWGYLIISHILIIYLIWLVVRSQKMIKQLQKWVSDLQEKGCRLRKQLRLTNEYAYLVERIACIERLIPGLKAKALGDFYASENERKSAMLHISNLQDELSNNHNKKAQIQRELLTLYDE